MWKRIEETIMRAVSGIVYEIWGAVGFSVRYYKELKEIHLIVWNKSYKCEDKKEVVSKKFKFNLDEMTESQATHDIISSLEKYLLENYS